MNAEGLSPKLGLRIQRGGGELEVAGKYDPANRPIQRFPRIKRLTWNRFVGNPLPRLHHVQSHQVAFTIGERGKDQAWLLPINAAVRPSADGHIRFRGFTRISPSQLRRRVREVLSSIYFGGQCFRITRYRKVLGVLVPHGWRRHRFS